MASKIHTDNPKHHKYVTINKKERKKNNIFNINYNNININNLKAFLFTLRAIIIDNFTYIYHTNFIYSYKINKGKHTIYREPNYHTAYHNRHGQNPSYHGSDAVKGSNIIYNDCNHKTFKVTINKKYIKNRNNTIKTFNRNGIY